MTDTILIDAIINHGSVIQILGRRATFVRRHVRGQAAVHGHWRVVGRVRSVVGDARPMAHAIEALGLCPGAAVKVIATDEGDALAEVDT